MKPSPEATQRYLETRKRKYQENDEYRAELLERNRQYRKKQGDILNARRRYRWVNDLEYREKILSKRRGRDQRDTQLKVHYGITKAQYDGMLESQGRFCRVCGRQKEETLCVDHSHKTGQIRSLLCRKCNTGLGCFEDKIGLLMLAARYLKEHHVS